MEYQLLFKLIIYLYAPIAPPFPYCLTISALGQSGAWTPNYATATSAYSLRDTGYGRHSQNLRERFLRTIFPNVYASALAAPPVDNNESNNRRERARLAKNAAFIYFIGMQPLADSVTTLEKATANSLQSKSLNYSALSTPPSPRAIDRQSG